jgi:hypothetical protein
MTMMLAELVRRRVTGDRRGRQPPGCAFRQSCDHDDPRIVLSVGEDPVSLQLVSMEMEVTYEHR